METFVRDARAPINVPVTSPDDKIFDRKLTVNSSPGGLRDASRTFVRRGASRARAGTFTKTRTRLRLRAYATLVGRAGGFGMYRVLHPCRTFSACQEGLSIHAENILPAWMEALSIHAEKSFGMYGEKSAWMEAKISNVRFQIITNLVKIVFG